MLSKMGCPGPIPCSGFTGLPNETAEFTRNRRSALYGESIAVPYEEGYASVNFLRPLPTAIYVHHPRLPLLSSSTSLIEDPASLLFHAGFRPRATRSFCFGKRTQNHWRPGVAPRVPLPQSRFLGLRNSLRSDSPRPQNRGCGPGAQPRPQAPGCSAASFAFSSVRPERSDSGVEERVSDRRSGVEGPASTILIVTGTPPPPPAVSAATRNPINLTEQSKITINTLYLTVHSIIAVPQNRYQTPRHGSLRRAPILLAAVVVCLIPWGAARAQTLPTLSIDSPSVTEPHTGTRTLTYTVSLNPASAEEVTVDYADATPTGTDYATRGAITWLSPPAP